MPSFKKSLIAEQFQGNYLKPTKNSTRPNLIEIPAHFIHEIKTKGYDVIGVNVFYIPQINEVPLQKRLVSSLLYYCYQH